MNKPIKTFNIGTCTVSVFSNKRGYVLSMDVAHIQPGKITYIKTFKVDQAIVVERLLRQALNWCLANPHQPENDDEHTSS